MEIAALLVFASIILLSIASLAAWIWSLIHCIKNKEISENNRIIGILLIVFLGLIGSIIYLFIPRERSVQREAY